MRRERLVLSSKLTPDKAAELAGIVKALAEPSRLQLVSVLHAADRWMNTVELRPVLGAAEDMVAHHLKVLAAAGVTRRKVIGGVAVHRLLPGAFAGIVSALRGGR